MLTAKPDALLREIASVPEHCTPMVTAVARACAEAWQEFAERLECR